MTPKWVIIDNGFKLKIHKSGGRSRLGENAIVVKKKKNEDTRLRHYEIDENFRKGGYAKTVWYRPLLKGFCVDIPLQAEIWERIITDSDKGGKLVVTAPPLATSEALHGLVSLALEYFKFSEVTVVIPQLLTLLNQYLSKGKNMAVVTEKGEYPLEQSPPMTGVVVDIGAAATHIVPFVGGSVCKNGYRRVDVGGHTITANIQLAIAKRCPYLETEFYVIDALKERLGYVSEDFATELHAAKKRRKTVYCMPDYDAYDARGSVVPEEKLKEMLKQNTGQCIRVMNEAFTSPELFLTPNIGSAGGKAGQGGICEAVMASIKACPEVAQPALWGNVILSGASIQFPGLKERVLKTLRQDAPSHVPVTIRHPAGSADDISLFPVLAGEAAVKSSFLPPAIAASKWSVPKQKQKKLVEEMWEGFP